LFFIVPICAATTEAFSQQCLFGDNPKIKSGGTTTATTISIGWFGTGGADNYRLQYNLTSAAADAWLERPSVPFTTLTGTIPDLLPSTEYRVRVRVTATCSVNHDNNPETAPINVSQGANGDPVVFTTASLPIPVLNPCSSPNPNTINFAWAPGAACVDCGGYSVDISAESNFIPLIVNQSIPSYATTSFSKGSLLPGKNYFYLVRSVAGGSASGNSSPSAAVPTRPETPVADQPTDIATTSLKTKWHSNNGNATRYKLEVSTAADFSAIVTTVDNISFTETSHIVNGLLPGVTYHYRVSAAAASMTTGPSNIITVKTISPPPVAVAPDNLTTTSFRAKWNAATGAESYQLAVSADNFNSLLPEYNNVVVNGTSVNVDNLNPGTIYQYKVRPVNASGVNLTYSNSITTVTVPPTPVADDASDFSTTGFTANWQSTTGAASYRIDVSEALDFTIPLQGYTNLTVNGTSQIISNLTSGVQYHYRVRAVNASGTSGDSNTKPAKTISPPPVVKPASSATNNSFTANWDAAAVAEHYRLDVATDENFDDNSFATGYNDLEVPSTSHSVTGLLAGRTYYYRLRTGSSAGISVNSETIQQLTLPPAPEWKDAFVAQPDRITISWDPSISAIGYELEASSRDDFSELVTGYNPKNISGTLSDVVTGLSAATTYYFRIKARNGSGLSDYSLLKPASTLNADGSRPQIEFSISDFARTQIKGSTNQQEISIAAQSGTLLVDFYHRKKSKSDFTKESVSVTSGNLYKVTMVDDWFDDFGMEFYFEVRDLTNQIKREPAGQGTTHSIFTKVSSFTIPIDGFGGELNNYRIISFPYALQKMKIEDILIPVMTRYDKSLWRFVRFQDGKNEDYLNDELRLADVGQGKGYWFLSKEDVSLTFSDGTSYGNSLTAPFVLHLDKGWNQIGNPFPYDLSWQDVLADNSNPGTVSPLYIFDSPNVSFAESDQLKVFSGGFVFAEEATELQFRTTLEKNTGGRSGFGKSNSQPGEEEWSLPIGLTQGEVKNTVTGIGMAAEASDGKDRFDRITSPRFIRFVEFNSHVEGFDYTLAKNIVGSKEKYEWNYQVESNANEEVRIHWDAQIVKELGASLVLFDRSNKTIVNMASVDSYVTTPSAKISIYYERKTDQSEMTWAVLGKPYPNPFQEEVLIPFDYSFNDSYQAELLITDAAGKIVMKKQVQPEGDLKCVKWDGKNAEGFDVTPGLYIYRICNTETSSERLDIRGRLIKK
jgi:phosphodiesterase/alkaline phosphatase D-like protein